MTITVITDSSASLPDNQVEQLGIVVVPLNVLVGAISYKDGELSPQEIAQRTDQVRTSSPSPGEFAKAIDDNDAGDGALVITVASSMSSTHQSAKVAATYFDQGKVQVLDSTTAAGAQGLVVLAAAEAAAGGASVDEVRAVAAMVAAKVRLLGALQSLDALARSGRVPLAAAWAGDSLGVRILFEFQGGRAKPCRPAFGMKGALDRIVAAIEQPGAKRGVLRAAVVHAHAEREAARLETKIRASYSGAAVFTAPFSAVMVAHTGPGLVGAAWWWDDTFSSDAAELAA